MIDSLYLYFNSRSLTHIGRRSVEVLPVPVAPWTRTVSILLSSVTIIGSFVVKSLQILTEHFGAEDDDFFCAIGVTIDNDFSLFTGCSLSNKTKTIGSVGGMIESGIYNEAIEVSFNKEYVKG